MTILQMLGVAAPPEAETYMGVLNAERSTGEDCLALNVWTPAVDAADRLPVLVWLHGGGWSTGSASWPLYDFTNFARNRQVVVVGVNHRLGILGFLDLSQFGDAYADSGNVGIAAAMVIVDEEVAREGGLRPRAVIRAWASAGVPPARTGLAPTLAVPKALARAGLGLADVDLWEINEAFASMSVATTRILGIDDALVNVSGSGCSLGHPIAMTGARMIMTLVGDLERRGGGTGVAAMCAGGGMSTAVVIDVPAG